MKICASATATAPCVYSMPRIGPRPKTPRTWLISPSGASRSTMPSERTTTLVSSGIRMTANAIGRQRTGMRANHKATG